jgi:hypothetical protein
MFLRFTANEPENLEPPSLFPAQQVTGNPTSAISPGMLSVDLAGLAKKKGGKVRPIDRLMMIRLLRPERLPQAIERFISEVFKTCVLCRLMIYVQLVYA